MARPQRNDGRIHLHPRKNGANLYASSNEAYEKEDKRCFRIVDWGTIDDGNVFVPGKRFLYEKNRWDDFVFPPEWDLSRLEELKAKYKPGRPAYAGEDRSLLYGSVWFLTEVARKLDLVSDLMTVFDGNTGKVNDILTLAFFPLVCPKSYNHLARWQGIERMPSAGILTSKDITQLTQSITESNRMDLFKMRMSRIGKSDILAIDSTSKSTYGRSLADIRWGRNKEGIDLAQTNEVVVYSLCEHEPAFYQELPGNMPDLRTMELIQTMLEHAGCPGATRLTDRGYVTQCVLDFLLRKKVPFLCCIKAGSSMVSDIIRRIADGEIEMEINLDTKNYECQSDVTYWYEDTVHDEAVKSTTLKADIYFDSVRKSQELRGLDIAIKEQRILLSDLIGQKTAIPVLQDLRSDCPLYDIVLDKDNHVSSFALNEKRVESRKRTMGYIVMLQNRLDYDSAKAWETYRLRDEQEKYFSDMKGAMLDDRNPAWSEKGKEGRLLVHFVGLVVYSHIKHIWKKLNFKDQFETVDSIIDEMKGIRCIEHNGRAKIVTPFVGLQLKVCEYFGLEVPKGCGLMTKHISSKTGRRKKNAALD